MSLAWFISGNGLAFLSVAVPLQCCTCTHNLWDLSKRNMWKPIEGMPKKGRREAWIVRYFTCHITCSVCAQYIEPKPVMCRISCVKHSHSLVSFVLNINNEHSWRTCWFYTSCARSVPISYLVASKSCRWVLNNYNVRCMLTFECCSCRMSYFCITSKKTKQTGLFFKGRSSM